MSRSGTAGGGSPPCHLIRMLGKCAEREQERDSERDWEGETLIDLHANRNGKRLRKRQRNRGRAEEGERAGEREQEAAATVADDAKFKKWTAHAWNGNENGHRSHHNTPLDSTQLNLISRDTLSD